MSDKMFDQELFLKEGLMEQYEALWKKYQTPWTPVNTIAARDFLTRMQYSEREIDLLTDD